MAILFSDLDNTMIYSHRWSIAAPKVVAEFLNGREQSYMPMKLYDFLRLNTELNLVPVTTRSIAQYERIFLLSRKLNIHHVLVCNGGILIVNGSIDKCWFQESLEISCCQNKEVLRLLNFVKAELHNVRVYDVEQFMFYFSTERIEEDYLKLLAIADLTKVYIGRDSRKIYIIAMSINKGAAVERYRRRFNISECITAGDSELDLPMLEFGNPAIISPSLHGKTANHNIISSKSQILAFEMADILAGLSLGVK